VNIVGFPSKGISQHIAKDSNWCHSARMDLKRPCYCELKDCVSNLF